MKLARFSPRTVFLTTMSVIAVVAMIGWIGWSVAVSQYRGVIDGWIEEGRAAGYQIEYSDRQTFGFPRRMTMRLIKLHWKNADGIDFYTDDMDIVATPWDWQNFEAKFKNHVVLSAPMDEHGGALFLSGGEGHAQVHLDGDGVWQNARVALDNAEIGFAPRYVFKAGHINASVTRPATPPKNRGEVGLALEGEASDITAPDAMPSPFGARAEKFTTRMRVMGRVPDVRRRKSMESWNKDGGIVAFDDFSLSWGVLGLTSKGTLGFDDDLQPEGVFAGNIKNPKETMKALLVHGFVAMHDTTMLDAVMTMFSRTDSRDSPGMALPITVQLGGFFLGPIRVLAIPTIEWASVPDKMEQK